MSSVTAIGAGASPRWFDLAELRDLRGFLGGENAHALFATFAEELPRYRSELEAAAAQHNLRELARTVHNLRGTALSFSCTGLAPLCESVQSNCERGDIEACRQSAATLAFAYVCAIAELQALRAPGGVLAA